MSMKLKLSAVAALAVMSASTMAAGFMLGEQSAVLTGRGYAGAGASADDLSGVFYNPASMTLLPGTRAQVGTHIIGTSFKFKEYKGTTTENGRAPEAAVPAAFFTHQINENLWFGFGLTTPYGMATSYNRGWKYGARGDYAKIETIDINPSIAWKVSDQISVGAGVSAQYAHAKLGMNLATDDATAATGMHGYLDVDGWKYGFNVGATYQPTETLRFGLSYRSAMSHKADGDFKVDGLAAPGIGNTVDFVTNSTARLKTPATAVFSTSWKFAPKWTASTIVRWSKWSNLKNISIANKKESVAQGMASGQTALKGLVDGMITKEAQSLVGVVPGVATLEAAKTVVAQKMTGAPTGTPYSAMLVGAVQAKGAEAVEHVTDVTINSNFRDTWLVGAGLDYEVNSDLTVRGGVAFETNPLKNQHDRLAVLPDSKRLWLTTGASYKPTKNMQVDFALVYLKALETSELYNYQDGKPVGKFSSHSVFGGVQLQYIF